MKISLVVPNRDNLKYFKWSYESIRKNQGEHEIYICSASDACTDGTLEYYESLKKLDDKFSYIVNEGPNRLGHTILYDRIVNELVKTDVFMIWHCDMFLCPGALDAVEKHIKPGTVVSLTRIEPPLHPPGPEKIVAGFGTEPEDFDKNKFLEWFTSLKHTYANVTTEGIFAPWAIYKKDFQSIGGHDPLFAPQSKEDSDIFNRFLLNGYKFVQTWDGFVYHMTCRGSRFNPTLTTVGKESPEWLKQNVRSARNFIRKWGHFVQHDAYMKPIVPKKYDVGFVIKNATPQLVSSLEPWCGKIYCDCDCLGYILAEQKNTAFKLNERIFGVAVDPTTDVVVEFDGKLFTENHFQIISNLSDIITETNETGNFEIDIFKVNIKKISSIESKLIHL
jgi:glycosyltransferase involved in cell wall biosynthesis